MAALERTVTEVASTEGPVFITGESGTGKDMLALVLHQLSSRKDQTFHKLHCASQAPSSESAWRSSGALIGLSALQQKGTVVLDDVVELGSNLQSCLAESLSNASIPGASPRWISLTRWDIDHAVHIGRFQQILYSHLKGVLLKIPPLRERKEDIPFLSAFFVEKHRTRFSHRLTHLSDTAQTVFMRHDWPGNVRELENTVITMLALGEETAVLETLKAREQPRPAQRSLSIAAISLKQASKNASQRAEKELIYQVLERTRWNRKRAARELQISYKALLYKLKQIGPPAAELTNATEN